MSVERTGIAAARVPRGARARSSLGCARTGDDRIERAVDDLLIEEDRGSSESKLPRETGSAVRATPTRRERKLVTGRLVPRSASRIERQKALGSLARVVLGGRVTLKDVACRGRSGHGAIAARWCRSIRVSTRIGSVATKECQR
jgi:inner membrane protein involved in colicin E2 resistance